MRRAAASTSSFAYPTGCAMRSRVNTNRPRESLADKAKAAAKLREASDEFVSPAGDNDIPQVGGAAEGGRGFLGFGKKGRTMPLNPLHVLQQSSNKSRTTQQLLQGVKKLRGANIGNIQLSEEQQVEIAKEWSKDKWWGKTFSRVITKFPPSRSRTYIKMLRIASVVLVCIVSPTILFFYSMEMNDFGEQSDEDRALYRKCVLGGIRISDLYKIMNAVIKRDDPNGLLTSSQTIRLLIKEMRALGLGDVDWDVEMHERKSPFEEYDLMHLSYWFMLKFASVIMWSEPFAEENWAVMHGSARRDSGLRGPGPEDQKTKGIL